MFDAALRQIGDVMGKAQTTAAAKDAAITTALDVALQRLHDEGRYRTFIDILRKQGQFPQAIWRRPDGSERELPTSSTGRPRPRRR